MSRVILLIGLGLGKTRSPGTLGFLHLKDSQNIAHKKASVCWTEAFLFMLNKLNYFSSQN
jgi:hypothetical protein